MQTLIDILTRENLSLVIRDAKGTVRRFTGRGVSDLYHLYRQEPDALRDAEVADKIVGRGAAALIVAGGAKRLHTLTLSRPAEQLLAGSDVAFTAEMLVDNIIRLDGKGICPVELATIGKNTVGECIDAINDFMKNKI